jgi:hypothetical protein
MVIGAEDDDPLVDEPAEPVGVVPAELLLLLLLLLHAARTPTESATAPSATAFLENQGRCALTPGSSFLIAYLTSETSSRLRLGPVAEGYTGGLLVLRDKHGEIHATVSVRRAAKQQQSFA